MSNREEFEKEFKLRWEVGHYILKMVKFIDESNDYAPINAVKTMSDEYYWVLALNTGWWAWQAQVPEGYVVVPKEPTDEMISKAQEETPHFYHVDSWYGTEEISESQAIACYEAMIEAVEK